MDPPAGRAGACLATTLFFLVGTAGRQAQETHPFNVHDLWEMERISDPQLSPDGRWVVFGISSLDQDANRRRSDLWIVGTDGTDLRRLTTDPASDFNPRWAPDGSAVYFLSSRSGSSQVWRLGIGRRRGPHR